MRLIRFTFFFIGVLFLFTCSKKINNETGQRENANQTDPYLILISLDGFRWDYVERFKPPHLSKFINEGVQAESLIPSYPSKTFPNHYTIATGMYPDKHNILGNSFYSYEHNKTYSIRARELVSDGTYYDGTPIWVQASKAGLKTASFFFVGTEADIQGVRPDYYYNYDGRIKNEERIKQALTWLGMPEESRPHMMTLYFSDMDDIGHRVGPNNDELIKQALMKLDAELGTLFEGINKTGLPINTIIVSDHGMKEVHVDHYLAVEKTKSPKKYRTVNNGAIVSIHPYDLTDEDQILEDLNTKEGHYTAYKTADVPFFEYEPQNENWGPIQLVPDSGYYFNEIQRIGVLKSSGRTIYGHHGYDPEDKDMHGIFYANGPALKAGYTTASVKNIHVYPLMCRILGLDIPADIDGKAAVLSDVLR